MFSENVVLEAIIVVVGGLCLYAACAIGWGFSKEIQPLIDDSFGNYPRKRGKNNPDSPREPE